MIVTDIPLDKLVAHPRNVRSDVGDLTELAASIKAMGVLQPLTVAPNMDGGYEPFGPDSTIMRPATFVVIAGHRRQEAARKAGLATIPCIIRDDLVKQADQIEAMLVENLQRTDLTVMEEAAAYSQLELLGVKPTTIAKKTGRSRATVDSRLKLMALPETTRACIDSGQMSLADAEFIAKHADDAEIMTAVDGKTGSNARWAVESVLRKRRWAEEEKAAANERRDPAPPTPEEAARQAEHEAMREARRARETAFQTSIALQYQWALEQYRVHNARFLDGAMRMAAENLVDENDEHPVFELMGIDPCGQDEDGDDYHLRVMTAVRKMSIPTAGILVALVLSDVLNPPHWGVAERLSALVEHCGYDLSDAEKTLMESAL